MSDEIRIQNALKTWSEGKMVINPVTHRIEDSFYKKILFKTYEDIDFLIYKTKISPMCLYFKKINNFIVECTAEELDILIPRKEVYEKLNRWR